MYANGLEIMKNYVKLHAIRNDTEPKCRKLKKFTEKCMRELG